MQGSSAAAAVDEVISYSLQGTARDRVRLPPSTRCWRFPLCLSRTFQANLLAGGNEPSEGEAAFFAAPCLFGYTTGHYIGWGRFSLRRRYIAVVPIAGASWPAI